MTTNLIEMGKKAKQAAFVLAQLSSEENPGFQDEYLWGR